MAKGSSHTHTDLYDSLQQKGKRLRRNAGKDCE